MGICLHKQTNKQTKEQSTIALLVNTCTRVHTYSRSICSTGNVMGGIRRAKPPMNIPLKRFDLSHECIQFLIGGGVSRKSWRPRPMLSAAWVREGQKPFNKHTNSHSYTCSCPWQLCMKTVPVQGWGRTGQGRTCSTTELNTGVEAKVIPETQLSLPSPPSSPLPSPTLSPYSDSS